MGQPPKNRVTVPMYAHKSGLHDGHKALLEIAKDIGDRVVVPIAPKTWHAFIRGDVAVGQCTYEALTNQIATLEEAGVAYTLIPESTITHITDEDRQRWRERAEAVLSWQSAQLYTDYYRQHALGIAMDLCRQIEQSAGRVKTTVKGPEFHQFLIKAIKPPLGSNVEVVIMPKIYTHPETNIKLQSGIPNINPIYYDEVARLHYVIQGVKERLITGPNLDLVREINESYVQRHWELLDISLWEGHFVDRGRLITANFRFPTLDGGRAILSDTIYESP